MHNILGWVTLHNFVSLLWLTGDEGNKKRKSQFGLASIKDLLCICSKVLLLTLLGESHRVKKSLSQL